MVRVSSGPPRAGPPAHANRTAFVHNRNSKKTRRILAAPISGLCPPCRAVLEWRKRYRKYKPLSVAKKCVRCQLPAIKEAYHVVCNACASAAGHICCKCLLPPSQWRADSEVGGESAAGADNSLTGSVNGDSDKDTDSDTDSGDRPGGLAANVSADDYDNLSDLAESVPSDINERITILGGLGGDSNAVDFDTFDSEGLSDSKALSDLDGLSDGCSDSDLSVEERIIELKV